MLYRTLLIISFLLAASVPHTSYAEVLTTFELFPPSSTTIPWKDIYPVDISGDQVVGTAHSPLFLNRTFIRIGDDASYPQAYPINSYEYYPLAIVGDLVIGNYFGFDPFNFPNGPQNIIYDHSNGTTSSLINPTAEGPTLLYDYDGARYLGLGFYNEALRLFTSDGATIEYVSLPVGYTLTDAVAGEGIFGLPRFRIEGDRIIGTFWNEDAGEYQSLVLSGDDFTIIRGPNGENVYLTGISGETLVGGFDLSGSNPFVLHHGQFMFLQNLYPDIVNVLSIDGDRVVGSYRVERDGFPPTGGVFQLGYVLQLDALSPNSNVPEPASLLVWSMLLAIGGGTWRIRFRPK